MTRATILLTVASSVVAWLAMAGMGAAQTTAPALSALEVIQYVASGQPADHARLRDHFVALADRYTADAARHAAMMTTFAGNPNRTSGENLAVYCRRQIDRATDAAGTAAGLAYYHGLLADDILSAAPARAWRFEAGEGARQPTDREVRLARLDARTRAEHGALQEYFAGVAARETARADAYSALAQAYRGSPNRRGGDPAVHFDRMAGQSREAATEARAAAFDHRQTAG
jgi:hypothetical protein